MRQRYRYQEVMDWRAAILAGLVAGVAFLAAQWALCITAVQGGLGVALRYVGSALMGRTVPPTVGSLTPGEVILAILFHLLVSVVLTVLLAFIVHRWRLLVSTVAGLLFGLGLYLIVFHGLLPFFPWLVSLRGWISLAAYVLFGGLAGFVYELLERDRLVVEGEA